MFCRVKFFFILGSSLHNSMACESLTADEMGDGEFRGAEM
jgi:hypothetical protein